MNRAKEIDRIFDAALDLPVNQREAWVLSECGEDHAMFDEVTARMKARGRGDDTDESIAKRLALYDTETMPVIDWFRERGLVVSVDGFGTEDEVTTRLFDAIDALLTTAG